jgi:hypothetical protein
MSWHGFKTENEYINKDLPVYQGVVEKDPSGISLNTPGAKADAGKIRPWLMMAGFARALELVSEVTTKGAEKYTPNGWAEVPEGIDRYMEGFGRHMLKLGRGEVYDNGPNGIGTKHKAQMIWNLLASLELEEREKSTSET